MLRIYGDHARLVLTELEELGVRVGFGVDGTALSTTLPGPWVPQRGFDRVIWNFPCVIDTHASHGEDARVRRPDELHAQHALLSRFFGCVVPLLSADGGEASHARIVILIIVPVPAPAMYPCRQMKAASSNAFPYLDGMRIQVHLTHKLGLRQWWIERQGVPPPAPPPTALCFVGTIVFDRSAYPPYR